jgi:hypothetical protein
MVGIGGEQKLDIPAGSPERKDNFVPSGLINFVDLRAGQGGIQFMDQAGQAKRVQGHGDHLVNL